MISISSKNTISLLPFENLANKYIADGYKETGDDVHCIVFDSRIVELMASWIGDR